MIAMSHVMVVWRTKGSYAHSRSGLSRQPLADLRVLFKINKPLFLMLKDHGNLAFGMQMLYFHQRHVTQTVCLT